MTIGHNTLDGQKMMAFISRIEEREGAKKVISDDIALIYAEAKASNLSSPGMRAVVKARKLKPSQFREGEDLREVYFHAAGLATEPPLFRSIEALASDGLTRSALVESFKKLVPASGSIVLEMDGPPLRLTRGKDGEVRVEEVTPPPVNGAARKASSLADRPAVDVPDCSPDEAQVLGTVAFNDDQPITANPFPLGDKRQARWEAGWMSASGSDGMGPSE